MSKLIELKTAACGYRFTLFATNEKEKPFVCTVTNDSVQLRYHRWLNKEVKALGNVER